MEKKKYVKPVTELLEVDSAKLLSDSSENGHGHGRENACAHGSHAWFCSED